jgi:hypothetical protein
MAGLVWLYNQFCASVRPLLSNLICCLRPAQFPDNLHTSQSLAQTRGFTRPPLNPQNLSFGSSPDLNPLDLKMESVCPFLNCACAPQSLSRCADEAISNRRQSNLPQYRWFWPAAI